jgi:acetyltransferase-like isoleucine patch superfamily enzyme
MPGAIVNCGSSVGEFAVLNTQCSADHDCILGSYSSLAPGARLGGRVVIGEFSAIGIGAVIREGITIGNHTVVGAGSTVLRDLPSHVVAYGTPARVIRQRNPGDSYLDPHNQDYTL